MSCKSNPANVCCGGKCVTKNGNNLLLWKDPKKSGITFASILSFLLLVKYVNLVSLFFRISTFALLISAISEYLGKVVTGTGFVTKFKPKQPNTRISEVIDYYAPHFVKISKNVEIKIQELYTSVNIESTLKFGVLSFILYKLTNSISIWSLLFTSTILLFTVPLVYSLNKEIIDKNIIKIVNLVKSKIDENSKLVNEKYGPQIEKAKKSLKPILNLVESKIPVRTAGTTVGETSTKTSTSIESNLKNEIDSKTSSSAPHLTTAAPLKKPTVPAVPTTEETEVDFNSFGEQLKQEAHAATANSPIYSKEQIDSANPFNK